MHTTYFCLLLYMHASLRLASLRIHRFKACAERDSEMPSAVAARCTWHGLPLLASLQKPERKRSSEKVTAQRGVGGGEGRAKKKIPHRRSPHRGERSCGAAEGEKEFGQWAVGPHGQGGWCSAAFRGVFRVFGDFSTAAFRHWRYLK